MLYSNKPIIKHKVGLLNLAEEFNNVSQASKVKGVSRDRFYRYQELVEEGGVEALVNRSRRVPKNHSSRVLSGYVSKTFIRGFRKTSG